MFHWRLKPRMIQTLRHQIEDPRRQRKSRIHRRGKSFKSQLSVNLWDPRALKDGLNFWFRGKPLVCFPKGQSEMNIEAREKTKLTTPIETGF